MRDIVKPGTCIRITFCLVALVCIFSPLISHADEKDEKQRQLSRIDDEIVEIRNSISSLETDRQTTIRQLEQHRLQKKLHERESEKLGLQIKDTDAAIVDLQKEIDALNASISSRKEQVGKIIARLYTSGRYSLIKLLFSVNSSSEIGLAHTYLTYIARDEYKVISQYAEDMRKLDDSRNALTAHRDNLERMRNDSQQHIADAAEAAGKQQDMLNQIRQRRGIYEKSLTEKQQAKAELERLIARLESRARETAAATGFATLQGKLVWPAQGEIIGQFGKVRDAASGVELDNSGIDIKVPLDTDVRAIADGTVVYNEWNDAGGNMVFIDHGDGFYSLYAHLSRFLVDLGYNIKAGEVLGKSGETGSLVGPVLHFEIRQVLKDKGQRPLDPVKWLSK